ncbi:MAG: hypothetical protein WEB03_11500 [Nitriliruptor sp.]|uniref:hypothetical protein n=1 Tax=Nitriliruptor sp. TaxID=2448056 RepID=UPI00349FEF72
MTTRLGRATAALLAVLLVVTLPGVAAASPEERLDEAKERAADLDQRLTDAEAALSRARDEVAELEDALRVAGRALETAQAEQAQAEESAALARRRAERAATDLRAAEIELDTNQDALASFASETYKYGVATASPTLMTLRSLTGENGSVDLADSLQAMRLGLREQRRVIEEALVLRTRTEVLAAAAAEEERIEGGPPRRGHRRE